MSGCLRIVPCSDATGAEVLCGAIQDLDDAAFRQVHQAWLEHQVLLFREQNISDTGLVAFASRFGPVKSAPIEGGRNVDEATRSPEVHVVSNVMVDGVALGILGDGEVDWHTDMVSFTDPPTASMLYALEVPANGGDTLFNNMYLAYETLPAETRRRLIGLTVKHLVRANSSGAGTGAVHPLVITHPETRCNALFLGGRSNTFVTQLPRPESASLLDSLWQHAAQPRFGWRHKWRAGDVVVWDNRCLMHSREAFHPASRRILHRTQVDGCLRPFTAPAAFERPPHPRGLKVHSVA